MGKVLFVLFGIIGGGGGSEGAAAAITAGGGIVLPPPLTAAAIEPFAFDSHEDMASMVTVGGRCFEVEPVKPEAAILDLSDFG